MTMHVVHALVIFKKLPHKTVCTQKSTSFYPWWQLRLKLRPVKVGTTKHGCTGDGNETSPSGCDAKENNMGVFVIKETLKMVGFPLVSLYGNLSTAPSQNDNPMWEHCE